MFIQSRVFVLIEYTNFYILAKYDFSKACKLQRILARI